MVGSDTKPGIGLSSECQDLSVSEREIYSNKEFLVKNYKAESGEGDENSKSLTSSSTEIIGTVNGTDVEGDLPDEFNERKSSKICSNAGTKMLKCPISDESSVALQHGSSANYSLDEQSTDSTVETLSSLVDRHTADIISTDPGLTSVKKPTVPIQSAISSTVKVDTAPKPISATDVPPSEEPVVSDSNLQSVLTVPNATTVTSTTSSVITNVVSIACQKITESGKQNGSANDGDLTDDSELSRRVDDAREDIENKLRIGTPDLIATEIQSPNSQDFILGGERIENGMLPLNDSTSMLGKLSREQEINYDLAENGPYTPEIILSSNEARSFEKAPNEFVQVSENGMLESSIVDGISEKRISHKHSDKIDESSAVDMGVSDIGFSEVRSCLVQMPRDGTTVNVLGEEERPSRPKYLFLPSKITVENEQ
ncbi:hypothetical protein B7P43_G03637, partial [Cryptotermes secundus]